LAGRPSRQSPSPDGDLRLGLSVQRLDEAMRRQYNLPANLQGVVVAEVEQGTDAARKGLRAGDVIVRVGERRVSSPADLSSAVDAARAAGRRGVLLFVHREGRTLAVAVQLSSEVR
jgi:serine protease Do